MAEGIAVPKQASTVPPNGLATTPCPPSSSIGLAAYGQANSVIARPITAYFDYICGECGRSKSTGFSSYGEDDASASRARTSGSDSLSRLWNASTVASNKPDIRGRGHTLAPSGALRAMERRGRTPTESAPLVPARQTRQADTRTGTRLQEPLRPAVRSPQAS